MFFYHLHLANVGDLSGLLGPAMSLIVDINQLVLGVVGYSVVKIGAAVDHSEKFAVGSDVNFSLW